MKWIWISLYEMMEMDFTLSFNYYEHQVNFPLNTVIGRLNLRRRRLIIFISNQNAWKLCIQPAWR